VDTRGIRRTFQHHIFSFFKHITTMQSNAKVLTLSLLCGLMALFSNCKKDDPAPANTAAIQLADHPTLGKILTDRDGRTLYFFSDDVAGQNTCTGGCETAWPLFHAGDLSQDKLGSGLNIADFGTVVSLSGQQMTTYKGWPLYYFAPGGVLEAPGEVKGEASGGVWFVAKPDYTIMIGKTQLVGKDGKNYKSNYTEGAGQTTYFTASEGWTLYVFVNDKNLINTFTLADFSNNAVWPVFEETEIVVPSILDKTRFKVINVAGHKQLTFNGWPLYHYGGDNNTRGNTRGVSVPTPGVWPVAVQSLPFAPQ
jgi:predicted lipoprotein with Yx(FWY)xxD motif